MNTKWEKNTTNGYTFRNVIAHEIRVDDTYSVLILKRDDCFDSYVMQKNPGEPIGTPFLYMFGTPIESMPYSEVVKMTIRNVPHYYDLFNN